MSRRLVLLNVVSVMVALGAAGYIALALTEPDPKPMAVRPRPVAVTQPERGAATTMPPAAGAAGYSAVASRNLFSPTRTEAIAQGGPGGRPGAMLPKPNLHGVVLAEGGSIAYLEDPATRRVAGYRLGDSIAGGTIQRIDAERVVLSRPEGPVDVRLHDPSKPRPATPVPIVAPPGQPVQPGVAGHQPTLQVPGPVQVPNPVTPQPALPQGPLVEQPGPAAPFAPPRRSLPPNVIRRVPPSAPGDGQP